MTGSAWEGTWSVRAPQQNSGMPGSSFPARRSYAHKSVDATLEENGQPLVVSRRLILPRREEGRWSAVRRHCLCIHPELLAVLPSGISILSSRSHHLTLEKQHRELCSTVAMHSAPHCWFGLSSCLTQEAC